MTVSYRMDGRAVAPAAFYAAACNPQRSVAIEACAGAGKTWMLVSRILRALLDGAEPSQILAITFTRKAAGEMQQRLDDWLAAFAAPVADHAARVQALVDRGLVPADADGAAELFGSLQGQVLAQMRRVEIRTFHGWFAQLLAQAPLVTLQQLGLGPGLKLVEDTEVLRDDLYAAFYRQVHSDDLLRDDFLALTSRHRRHAVQQWLDAAWHRRTELEKAASAGTLDGSVPPASTVFADCLPGRHPLEGMFDTPWREELLALASALGARGKATSNVAAARLIEALAAVDPQEAFAGACKALMTDKGSARQKMGDLPAQQAAVDRLTALQVRAQQQDAHDDHRRMVRLSTALLSEYRRLKARRALADMGDLETVALAMLSDGDLSAWLQARLDRRLRHLLIDEFQDTSPVQWQALHGWLSGYAGAGGGQGLSVFIVGDPKQSIYRFRRAEPRVFAAARQFIQEALQGSVLECDHTRRNAPEIVNALNAVFADAADVEGWQGYRPHSTASTQGGTVRCLRMPDRAVASGNADLEAAPAWRDSLSTPRQAQEAARGMPEARQVAAAVEHLIADGVEPGEIMVLARRRSALVRVAEALEEHRLAYTMPEALSLQSSPEARDLIAVIDVLASPAHDLSLAHALRSPVFGVSDTDLLMLARRAGTAGSWWQALMNAASDELLSPGLARARQLLASWAELAVRLPPHDLLDRIVHEGEVMARLAASVPTRLRRGATRAVQALLATALDIDGGRYMTPYRFVRALRRDDVRARLSAPADAVRLLTVHGAKGLEARWVFVVDSHPQARAPERATLLVDWPTEQRAPRTVAFVAREGAVASSLAPLLEQEQAARAREEINGLYVAMTRAVEGLVFSATAPLRPDPRSWWSRAVVHAEPWVLPDRQALEAHGASDEIRVPTLPALALRRDEQGREADMDLTVDSLAQRLGRAVHRLLEWVASPNGILPEDQWPAAAAQATRVFGLVGCADEVLAMAQRILGSPEVRRFYVGPGLRWAGNELPIGCDGDVLRLDRLVLLEQDGQRHWWVLDYKLNSRPEELAANRAQLRAYIAAVRHAQPGDRVWGAFITGQGHLIQFE